MMRLFRWVALLALFPAFAAIAGGNKSACWEWEFTNPQGINQTIRRGGILQTDDTGRLPKHIELHDGFGSGPALLVRFTSLAKPQTRIRAVLTQLQTDGQFGPTPMVGFWSSRIGVDPRSRIWLMNDISGEYLILRQKPPEFCTP